MRSMFDSVFGDVFVACFVCLQFRTRKKTPFICRDQSFKDGSCSENESRNSFTTNTLTNGKYEFH